MIDSDHDEIQVTLSVSFNFNLPASEKGDLTPFEVASRLRLESGGFFIWDGKVEVELPDGTIREACFNTTEYDFLEGIFTGAEGLALEYFKVLPPDQRASWSEANSEAPPDPKVSLVDDNADLMHQNPTAAQALDPKEIIDE